MKNTVDASPLKESRSSEREQVSLANASKRALDQQYRATFAIQTPGNGVVTTLWDSGDMPLVSAWAISADVLGQAVGGGGRCRYVLEGLFYRNAGASAQQAATWYIQMESAVGFDAAFAASGNGVILTVQDNAVLTMNWSALVAIREVLG